MLHHAATTDAGINAFWRDALAGLPGNDFNLANLERRFFTKNVSRDKLAGERTFDKNDFTFAAGNTTRLEIQGLDR